MRTYSRRDPRCTHGFGWSVISPVNGGYFGHWRTKEDAEKDNALGQFVSKFNHWGELVCRHDWWPKEKDAS